MELEFFAAHLCPTVLSELHEEEPVEPHPRSPAPVVRAHVEDTVGPVHRAGGNLEDWEAHWLYRTGSIPNLRHRGHSFLPTERLIMFTARSDSPEQYASVVSCPFDAFTAWVRLVSFSWTGAVSAAFPIF